MQRPRRRPIDICMPEGQHDHHHSTRDPFNHRYTWRQVMADSSPAPNASSPSQLPSQRTRKTLRIVSVHHTRLSPAARLPSAKSALHCFIDENGRVTASAVPHTPVPWCDCPNAGARPSAGLSITTLNGTISGDDTWPSDATSDQAGTPGLPLEPGVESLSRALPFSPRAGEGFPTRSFKDSAKPAPLSPAPITSFIQHAMFSRFGLPRPTSRRNASGKLGRSTSPAPTTRKQPKVQQLVSSDTRCPVEGYVYTFGDAGQTALPRERTIVYSNKSGCDLLREVKRPINYVDHVRVQRTPPKQTPRFAQRHDSGAQGLVLPSPSLDPSHKRTRRQSA